MDRAYKLSSLKSNGPWFDYRKENEIFLLSEAYTKPSVLWVPGIFPQDVEVATRLNLLPRLIMNGAVPPFPTRLHNM
jgi:hypothetical protein